MFKETVRRGDLNERGKASALAAFFLPVTFTMVVKVGPEY